MSQLHAIDPGFGSQTEEQTPAAGHISDGEAAYAARVLAGLFGSLEPLGEEEAREAVDVLSHIPGGGFDAFLGDSEGFRSAWNETRHLVSFAQDTVRLQESVYKIWTSDKSHPLAGRKGLAWGEPAVHMAEVLAGFGMTFDSVAMSSPDHLSVLLEFLAFLIENRPKDEIASFCADHLDWLPDLKREARLNSLEKGFVGTIEAAERLIATISSQ